MTLADDRIRLIMDLRREGITDTTVLGAIERVPREQFVPEKLVDQAYANAALPIDHDQTISQPFVVAAMTAKLDVGARMKVLEIGTGSGLISLYCLEFGARNVVATDVNQLAVANALYNAERMGFEDRFETRLVPLDDTSAYRVIGASERFDLIISNPPWENAEPKRIFEYAYFDPNFVLLRSLLDGLRDHLNPGGKALLAYGAVDGIQHLLRYSEDNGLRVRILDDRKLEDLPPVFVPGMLLEVSF